MADTNAASDVWDDDKWQRYGLLTGVVFVVLQVVSFFASGQPPARDAPADEFAKYFVDNDSALKISALFATIALIFGLWWLGSLWRVIGRLEPSGPRLALIAVAGFLMSGSIAAVLQAIYVVPALHPESLASSGEFVFTLVSAGYSASLATIAAHMMALGALALWTKFVPTWLGYLAFLSAVTSAIATIGIASEAGVFIAFQVIGFMTWILWVLVASIVLYRSSAA